MTILIDLDNVLENMGEVWVEALNERHGTTVKYDDITDWDVTKFFPSLSHEEVYKPLAEPEFWDRVTPISGVVETVRRLIDLGHSVYVVTASHYTTLCAKLDRFLFKYFPYLNNDNIIVTTNKQMIKGDVLIDDAPHNFGGDYKLGLLFDAPHNRNYDERANGLVRVFGWDEIYQKVRGWCLDEIIDTVLRDSGDSFDFTTLLPR